MKWSHKESVKELRNFDESEFIYYLYQGHTESKQYIYVKINVHVQKTSIILSNRR